MEVQISTKHLKAAACCAGAKDVRYYLNGVFAEVRTSEVRLVATNGSILAVLRDVNLVGENPVFPDVIIPNETVKKALTPKSETLTLTYDPDSKKWTLGDIGFTPIDGKFPEYRRAVPVSSSGEVAQFDPDLCIVFAKIAKILDCNSPPVIRHNGSFGAQVSLYGREDEFVGTIAPFTIYNSKRPDPGLTTWVRE
jgi:DNA polymerase-3 subunit beta